MSQMNVYCDRENKIIRTESDWKVCPYCGLTLTGRHGVDRYRLTYNPTLPGKYEECIKMSDNKIRFKVRAWGYLEAIEIRFDQPIDNMNTMNLHAFDFVPLANLANNPFHAFAKVRNV